MSPVRPCLSCGRLIPLGSSRCAGCSRAHQKARDLKRGTPAERGYDARWRRTRAAVLRSNPECCVCGRPAKHVHHLDGAGPRGPRGHDPSNLVALCGRCHGQETARMQPGGWNRRSAA